MLLKEFRELTKDLPEDSVLYALSDEKLWMPVSSLEVSRTQAFSAECRGPALTKIDLRS